MKERNKIEKSEKRKGSEKKYIEKEKRKGKEIGKEQRTDLLAKVKNQETKQGIRHTLNPTSENEGHHCIH
jgi:hypothetical protein